MTNPGGAARGCCHAGRWKVRQLSFAGWLLQNFFQLRGIVNLLASRIDLAFLAICLVGVLWVLTLASRYKLVLRIIIGPLLILGVVGLDWLAPKPLPRDFLFDLENGTIVHPSRPFATPSNDFLSEHSRRSSIRTSTVQNGGIYFTPPNAIGCGLTRVANGAGSTCTACWARR